MTAGRQPPAPSPPRRRCAFSRQDWAKGHPKTMSSLAAKPTIFNLDSASELFTILSTTELIEHAIRNGEGVLAANGALVARTGKYTGRTPKDKFVVRDS